MKRAVPTILLFLCSCAPNPMQYSQSLPANDAKYNSPECKEIRLQSLNYDDKVGERVAVGFASGLILGPFGLPIAVAADAERNQARLTYAREIHRRCSSDPMPLALQTDEERKVAESAPLSSDHVAIEQKIEQRKKVLASEQDK